MENISEFTYHHVRISPTLQSPAHTQPTWEISLVLKGSGYRVIGDMQERFQEGDLVLIPPGLHHCWYFDRADTDDKGHIENITLMFESSVLKSLALSMPSVKSLLDRLLGLDTSLTFGNEVRCELSERLIEMEEVGFPMNISRFVEILLLIAHHIDTAITTGRRTQITQTQQRLKQIETYIACNFSGNFTLDDLATHIGMNKSSLCCLFKRNTGRTIWEYVTDKRLEQAMYLLSMKNDDESIASICYKAGFQSVSHFNHLFKKKFGFSPRTFL